MKVGLIGYGKMGKAVEKLALAYGYEVSIGLNPNIDVAIDFSAKERVMTTAKWVCERKIPWVLGTTGWETDKECVLELVKKAGTSLLYGSNFSIGMAFFSKIVKMTHFLLKNSYAKAGIEMHHAQKKDAPSGTALQLIKAIPGLSFQSVRIGSVVGMHQLIFDSLEDSIELTHHAKSRKAFARGALLGAKWLIGRKGCYVFDACIEEEFGCSFQEQ